MADLDPIALHENSMARDPLGNYETHVIKLDANSPLSLWEEPVKLIQSGETVAFPTETVYGLGANALSEAAARKIFQVKKRPQDNPLIVHIHNLNMLPQLVSEIPDKARPLMEKFWPGPLTLLFKKSAQVPDAVTCGEPTVAVRMPSHPIALKLIELSGVPIAAPSANLSGRPSPTSAEHVVYDLNGRCKCIIDGGPTQVGLESTVVDVNRGKILRPGGVTLEQLLPFIPGISYYSKTSDSENLEAKPPTPGLKYRHYSPTAKVILLEGTNMEKMKQFTIQTWKELNAQGKKLGVINTHSDTIKFAPDLLHNKDFVLVSLGESDPIQVAKGLFGALRDLDLQGVSLIIMEGISEENEGMAVMNRIRKAASDVIHVD